jgi:hypothetical protein
LPHTTTRRRAKALAAASKYAQKKAKKRQTKKRKHLLSDVLRGAHTPDIQPTDNRNGGSATDGGHSHDNGGFSADAEADDGRAAEGGFAAGGSMFPGSGVVVGGGGGPAVATHTCPLSPSEAFAWMIHPLTPEKFFDEYWEKKPLLIKRKKKRYYGDLFTSGALDTMLREHFIKFGVNLVSVCVCVCVCV